MKCYLLGPAVCAVFRSAPYLDLPRTQHCYATGLPIGYIHCWPRPMPLPCKRIKAAAAFIKRLMEVTAMKRRFSAQHLYRLRNLIPIDVLITEKLAIPCKPSQGHLRFLCPLCRQFQTATMQKTNLARCFRCEKNFNTIELVMLWQNTDFVQSAKFLTELLQNLSGRKDCLSKAPTEAIGIGQVLRNLLCRPPQR